MADSLNERIAKALLAKLQTIAAFKRVSREQPTFDGLKEWPQTYFPGAALIERQFNTDHIRAASHLPDVVEKRTTVTHSITIYLMADREPETTLNNLSSAVIASVEGDQGLGISAEVRIVATEVTGGSRLRLEPYTAQTLDVDVTYLHDPSTL